MRGIRALVAVALVAVAAADAGATTARFEGSLTVKFAGKSENGRQILLEATFVSVADGTGGDAFTLSRRGIPVLGDVPLLGALFKSRTDRKAKFGSATNLFLLLTPTILDATGGAQIVGGRAPARAAPIAPPALAPTTTTLRGAFKVDRTFQKAKMKATLGYEGVAQDGEIAGETVKGKVKLRFAGDRI